jgi:hypothetical protein
MAYKVRADLTAQDLAIPSLNTGEYYTDDEMKNLIFIGWVDENTYEDDEDGTVAKFRNKAAHPVMLYSIDLDWVEEGSNK